MHVKGLILSKKQAEAHVVAELTRLHPTGTPMVKIAGFDLERGKGFTCVAITIKRRTKPVFGYAKRMNYDTRDMRADKQNDKVGLSIALTMALHRGGVLVRPEPEENDAKDNHSN